MLAASAILAAAGAARSTGPPPGLSANGQTLWQFEALLHDVFGDRQPYATGATYGLNFACAGNCFLHARWDPYVYVFANARGSSFRLKSRSFAQGAFGNYPVPLSDAFERAVRGLLSLRPARVVPVGVALGDLAVAAVDQQRISSSDLFFRATSRPARSASAFVA